MQEKRRRLSNRSYTACGSLFCEKSVWVKAIEKVRLILYNDFGRGNLVQGVLVSDSGYSSMCPIGNRVMFPSS